MPNNISYMDMVVYLIETGEITRSAPQRQNT